jgi:hypothetical protein
MSTQLEQTVRRALAEQAAELPADATAKVLAVSYRPRGAMVRATIALAVIPVVAAAATIAAFVVGAGPDASRAFAGWSATPTTAAASQISRAGATCRSHLTSMLRHAHEAPAQSNRPSAWGGFPASGWRTVLTDTRGPYTMIVLEANHGQAVATCFANGHSLVSLGVATGQRRPAPVPRGGVAFASSGSTTTPRDEGSRQFSQVVGRTGAGVTAVTIRLNNGTRVTATCANGWFLAWWPGSHGLASPALEVTTAAGIKRQ